MKSKHTVASAMLPVVTAFSSRSVSVPKFVDDPESLSGMGTHTRPFLQRPLARAIFMIVAGLMATAAAAHAADLTSDSLAAAAAGGTVPQAADAAQPPAAAGSVAPPVEQPKVKRLEAVTVTGSLIQVHSRSEESSSPLATIGIDQIAAAGQVSLDSAIGRMPQFAAAQGQSEVGDVQGATGFQGGQSYADLRGLGAERTLVLLDGQRLVPTNPNGAVDLNLIPMALLENVDVITGGASATYGSDAVAGVVNFRLRQDFQGIQLSAQTGGSTKGGGQENSASVLMGSKFADNKGNAVIDLEYNQRDAITGADRTFFSDPLNFNRAVPRAPEGIFSAGELGGNIPVSAVNAILAGYPGTTPIAGTGNYGGYIGLNSNGTLFTTRAPGNCVQNYQGPVGKIPGLAISPNCTTIKNYLGKYFFVQVPSHRLNLFSKVTYKINEGLEAYAQINFMRSTATDNNGPAFAGPGKFVYVPQNNPFVTGNAALMSLLNARTATTAGGSPSTGPLEMEAWLTGLGPRIESFRYNNYQLTAGLNGWFGWSSWKWNAFASYGQTNFNNDQQNNVNLPALENVLYGTANYVGSNGNNCVGYAWNPLGNHQLSPGCLAYVTGTAHNNMVLTQDYFQGTVSGDLGDLWAGTVEAAFGVDYRADRFNYQADSALNPAFNVMPSPIPPDIISPSYDLIGSTGGSMNVGEVFGELSVPLLSEKPFVKNLSLDLGERYSHYDLFGGENTWKASLRWQVDDALMFRGGFNRAIRAPSLQELYNPTVQAQDSINGDPCEVGSLQRSGPNAGQVAALCQAQGVPASVYPSFTYGLNSANGIITGNTGLQPEKSDTYTLGWVLTPHFEAPMARDIGMSLDYYHTSIKGAIAGVTLDTVLQNCYNANNSNPIYSESNAFCQRITRDPNTGAITLGRESSENIGSYVTTGVDMEAHWGFPLHDLGLPLGGRVKLQTFLSYVHSLTISGVPGVAASNYAGSIADTSTALAADGSSISDLSHPRWKANTTFGYSIGPVSAALHWRYISGMADLMGGAGSGYPGVPAYNYFDLDAHWQATHNIMLTAGVTNLTDKAPPRIAGAPLLTDAATYDVVGRTYFIGFKAKI
ncbi:MULTISPECIES: TonB-dependent receptor domain-containing protein [unclassified Rhodanobacter]|nr:MULTISPECIES: TonB-dependent receptor [unclassified Rhodanobacter]